MKMLNDLISAKNCERLPPYLLTPVLGGGMGKGQAKAEYGID